MKLNSSGKCTINSQGGYDIYASDFMISKNSLSDISTTKSRTEALVNGITNECDKGITLCD